jgi:hypothetical protein
LQNKKKTKTTLEDLLFLAEAFDSYTTGRNVNLKKVTTILQKEQEIVKQKVDRIEQKRILDAADFIINLPAKSKKATFYANLFLLTRFLVRVFIFLFVLLLTFFFTSNDLNENIVLSVGWGFVAILFLRWFSLSKLLEFYEEELKSQHGKIRHLKDGTQRIINLIYEYKQNNKIPGKKTKLHLYNVDYDKIMVIKKPNILREYYLTEVV